MTEQFARILQRWGADAVLESESGKRTVRAFIQRVRREDTNAPEEATSFGAADLRRWLYIGPEDAALQAGDRVACRGEDFIVQTAAAVYAGGERSHWWAVLRPEREALS